MRKISVRSRGFTLIELLIVVAIIAILALIAVPNFLEAQTRSKVSRVKADLRSLATALEAYMADWNSYTFSDLGDNIYNYVQGFCLLTTPIAYITTIPRDPFGEHRWPLNGSRRGPMLELGTGAANVANSGSNRNNLDPQGFPSNTWLLTSAGPDHQDTTNSNRMGFNLTEGNYPWPSLPGNDKAVAAVASLIYDPTNGTVSEGQVYRTGGMKPAGRPFEVLFAGWTK